MKAMNRITRTEARKKGLTHFFTGVPCTKGHLEKSYVSSGACVTCTAERSQKSYAKNKEYYRNKSREYRRLHPSKNIAGYSYTKEGKNRHKFIPSCLTEEDFEKMDRLYLKARAYTIICGHRYVVDHILPLCSSDLFNGLHVPWNLQIVSEKTNLSKDKHYIKEKRERLKNRPNC
jgi:5-methylcytosine-specific restriction endonuclease McrA